MFIHITYDSPKYLIFVNRIYSAIKYKLLRPILSFLLFYSYYIFIFKKFQKTENGKNLKSGISVYVPLKNEESFLMICLESLLPVVDQYILIDNGSEDNTLKIIKEFQVKYESKKEIVVLEMPDALLVEVVQEALKYVSYLYLLKWDGDMYCINDTEKSLLGIRKKILRKYRPLAFRYPYLNLEGDIKHTGNLTFYNGEPYLRTFYNNFQFKEEYGRLEHAVIPLYYKFYSVKYPCFFHFGRVKPLERMIYRDYYLDWREVMNTGNSEIVEKYKDFELFRKKWILHNFGTTEKLSLKFRIGRLFAQNCKIFNEEKYRKLPDLFHILFNEKKHIFEVIYRDNKPYRIIENNDIEFQNYIFTKEDYKWIPDISKYYSDKIRLGFVNQINDKDFME